MTSVVGDVGVGAGGVNGGAVVEAVVVAHRTPEREQQLAADTAAIVDRANALLELMGDIIFIDYKFYQIHQRTHL